MIALGAAFLAGCANIGAPPGGPQRTTPPELLTITPDSGAVNVRPDDAVFEFDAVVSDRASGARAGELGDLFLVSPGEGRPRVRWRRNRVEVRPRGGFRPNTTYSITMLPGIADLRGNVLRTGRRIVFSTGPAIAPYTILGRVFDWPNERVAPDAFVEVLRRPDSLPYAGVADSTGQFAIGPLEAGSYHVRAILDANRNRLLDPNELWDSLSVEVRGTSPFLELLAAPRDTLAPRLLTVSTPDSVTLNASFDRHLDPAIPLTPESFRVVGADSVALRIVSALTRGDAEARRARQDSARRDPTARDTVAAAAAGRLDRLRDRRAAPGAPGGVPTGIAASAATVKPSRAAPTKDVVIRLDSLTPMKPGESYRVTALNMRGLLERVRTSERVVTMQRARADSAAAGAAPGVRRP